VSSVEIDFAPTTSPASDVWIGSGPATSTTSRRYPTRVIDFLLATTLLILTSPLLVFVALLVATTSRGGVFYRSACVGRDGTALRVLKFRTMRVGADAALDALLTTRPELHAEWLRDRKLRRDPRVTRVGRLLRRCSLDELPQLVNVLKGEMAIIGPRPVTPAELEEYALDAPGYLLVRPGMTGVWQTSGRTDADRGDRLRLDVAYGSARSVKKDFRILARTAIQILTPWRAGAY
jgi:exopolysaccharide production protein ExoY